MMQNILLFVGNNATSQNVDIFGEFQGKTEVLLHQENGHAASLQLLNDLPHRFGEKFWELSPPFG
jgi:hypothetical protein